MVLLFRNDDLPILYMVLTLRNDVSKFDDFTLLLLDEVKPRDQL